MTFADWALIIVSTLLVVAGVAGALWINRQNELQRQEDENTPPEELPE